MADGRRWLEALSARWRRALGWSGLLGTLAWLAPLATATLALVGHAPRGRALVLALAVASAVGVVVAWHRRRRMAGRGGLRTLVEHLDSRLTGVGHGCELLLRPTAELGVLGRVQQARTLAALEGLARTDPAAVLPTRRLQRAGLRAVVGGVAVVGMALWLPPAQVGAGWRTTPSASTEAHDDPVAVVAPAWTAATIEVEPPTYTGLPTTRHDDLSLSAPVGSTIRWQIATVGGIETAALVAGDTRLDLAPTANGTFVGSLGLDGSMVYSLHLAIGGETVVRSAYARVEAVADRPPAVRIVEPPLVHEVDAAGRLPVVAAIDDDYGVASASLVATLALGAGEQVAFREARLPLDAIDPSASTESSGLPRASVAGGDRRRPRVEQQRRRLLDLAALGLEMGAELYFFVEVVDNAPQPQRTRSATHVVRWPGGDGGTIGLDSGIPMLLPPEMFRSQRQIIIDAEALLAEKASLDDETFERRSNNLGLDQHALRLRYGAMLGEEFEDGRPAREGDGDGGHDHGAHDPAAHGHDHDHDGAGDHGSPRARHDRRPGSPATDDPHDHGHAAENGGLFGQDDGAISTRMIDLVGELEGDLVHAHDSAESATFFPNEVRQTLKSSLANMWESEKHLRLFAPDEALPYAYRALRLLKEVQQASRVYVRRVGFDPTPLDLRRRLQGDDVDEVRARRVAVKGDEAVGAPDARRAWTALAAWGASASSDGQAADALVAALDDLLPTLLDQAAHDAVDLDAVGAVRTLGEAVRDGGSVDTETVDAVRGLLWRRLPPVAPAAGRRTPDGDHLGARYRQRLGDVP